MVKTWSNILVAQNKSFVLFSYKVDPNRQIELDQIIDQNQDQKGVRTKNIIIPLDGIESKLTIRWELMHRFAPRSDFTIQQGSFKVIS